MAKSKYKAEKHIKQRKSKITGLWSFQVFFEYLDYNNETQHYTKTFAEKDYTTTKEAFNVAIKHRDDIRQKLNTTGIPIKRSYTLQEIYEESKKAYPKSLETNRKRDIHFNKYLGLLKDKPIQKVSELDIMATLNAMIEIASDDVIAKVMTLWRYIYKTAKLKKLVHDDLTFYITPPKSILPRKPKDIHTDIATLEQIVKGLYNHVIKNNKKSLYTSNMIVYGLYIELYTGLRPAETFALKKQCIDLDKKTITIYEEIGSSLTEKNVIRATKTKDSTRIIPIADGLVPYLKQLITMNPDNDLLLPDFEGKLFNTTLIANKIYQVCKKENLKFNMYRLRHKFSTDLITGNTDPRTVMELMGHNNISMTLDYARSSEDLKKNALNNRKLS